MNQPSFSKGLQVGQISFAGTKCVLVQGLPSWQMPNLFYEILPEIKSEQLMSPFVMEHSQHGMCGPKWLVLQN